MDEFEALLSTFEEPADESASKEETLKPVILVVDDDPSIRRALSRAFAGGEGQSGCRSPVGSGPLRHTGREDEGRKRFHRLPQTQSQIPQCPHHLLYRLSVGARPAKRHQQIQTGRLCG